VRPCPQGAFTLRFPGRSQGYPAIAFDVRIEPGQTITYRANIL